MGDFQSYPWSTKHRIKVQPGDLKIYYTALASTLTNKENIELHHSLLDEALDKSDTENAFVIQHTTYSEVKKIISELRNDCSSGSDNIHVKFLKPVVEEIVSPIVHIINSSIDKEVFPDSWKVARVCPVPKIDNPIKEKDFRPISILPVLSKGIWKRYFLST